MLLNTNLLHFLLFDGFFLNLFNFILRTVKQVPLGYSLLPQEFRLDKFVKLTFSRKVLKMVSRGP